MVEDGGIRGGTSNPTISRMQCPALSTRTRSYAGSQSAGRDIGTYEAYLDPPRVVWLIGPAGPGRHRPRFDKLATLVQHRRRHRREQQPLQGLAAPAETLAERGIFFVDAGREAHPRGWQPRGLCESTKRS